MTRTYGSQIDGVEHPGVLWGDYVQNWLLFGLSKTFIKMALKGGTGIRQVYIENYRFSNDLDFTLFERVEKDRYKLKTHHD